MPAADAPNVVDDARMAVMDAPGVVADVPAVRWLDPDCVTAFDVVPLRELLEAMALHRVEPVLVPGRDSAVERLLALRAARDIPPEARGHVAGLFFGPCLEAVLWFADYRGCRTVADMRGVFGRADQDGQCAAIVRRAGADTVNLTFAGWTSLDFWRCPEAA